MADKQAQGPPAPIPLQDFERMDTQRDNADQLFMERSQERREDRRLVELAENDYELFAAEMNQRAMAQMGEYGFDILTRALPRGLAKGWEQLGETMSMRVGPTTGMPAVPLLKGKSAQEEVNLILNELANQELTVNHLSSLFEEPKTAPGKFAEPGVQFFAVGGPASIGLKAAGLGPYMSWLIGGAFGDATAFDPSDPLLSDMALFEEEALEAVGGDAVELIKQSLAESLYFSETESQALGRIARVLRRGQMATEGAALGWLFEGAVGATRAVATQSGRHGMQEAFGKVMDGYNKAKELLGAQSRFPSPASQPHVELSESMTVEDVVQSYMDRANGDAARARAMFEEDEARITQSESGDVVYSGHGNEAQNLRNGQSGVGEPAGEPGNVQPQGGVPRGSAEDPYRVRYEQAPTSKIKVGVSRVTTPEEAAHVFAPIRKHGQETLVALVTDAEGNILNLIRHTKGVKNAAALSTTELASAIASTKGAKRVWLSHNHPAGEMNPSSSDFAATRAVKGALDGTGISLEGHVVVGDGQTAGFIPSQQLGLESFEPIKIKPARRRQDVEITERLLRRRDMKGLRGQQIDGPSAAKAIVESIPDEDALILLNNRMQVIGIVDMNPAELNALRQDGRVTRLLEILDSTNANNVIIKTADEDAAKNVVGFFNNLGQQGEGVQVRDWFFPEGDGYTSGAIRGRRDVYEHGSSEFAKNKRKGGNKRSMNA